MKKLVFLSALFVLIAALVFTACKKDESNPNGTANWANPTNPFDYFGQQHNDGLDLLAAKRMGSHPNLTEDFRILAENGYDVADHKPFDADFAIILASKDPLKTISNKMRASGDMSQNLYSAVSKLNVILATTGLTGQFAADVKALEAAVPTLNLTERETETFYKAASIARFSNQYWMGCGSKEASGRMKKWVRALLIIGGDVAAGLLTENVGVAIEASVLIKDVIDGPNSPISTSGDEGGDNDGEPEDGDYMGKWKKLQWIFGSPGAQPPFPFSFPCGYGFIIPCDILFFPINLPNNPCTMVGPGIALDQNVVALLMDGSSLDPDFLNSLDSGVWEQEGDFTVSQEVVNEIMTTGGFQPPSEPTVFTSGTKVVHRIGDDMHLIVIPVSFSDGTTTTWLISISE